MSKPPTFTIEITGLSPDCVLARVQVGELYHRFYGLTEKQARARANIYIAEQRARHHKSEAAIEARRAGTLRHHLKIATEALGGAE